MQRLTRERSMLAFVVVSIILCVFVLLVTTNTITNVSAVEAEGIGVYWDSNCSSTVSSIDWGTLGPGSSKNIVVYIRNEVDEPQFLFMSTTNWDPSEASDYITLTWDYAGQRIDPDEILRIRLILSVSRNVEGISNFSFDIAIGGAHNFPGDLNGDGHVELDDLDILANHWFLPQYYDPIADINMDGKVDLDDLDILASNWGRGPLD